jgi:hypothetical protein
MQIIGLLCKDFICSKMKNMGFGKKSEMIKSNMLIFIHIVI